jgi:glyoxylase-like metal-dependent hydrolase (beta-lactamase superfamily II)
MGLGRDLHFLAVSVCAFILGTGFWVPVAVSPERTRAQGRQNFDTVKVEIHPVQGNIYTLTGAGGNVTVQTGPDGVLLVDTQFAPMAPKILAAIRGLTDKPIRYIIDTHVHGDHTGGNEPIAESGQDVKIIGHENLLQVMSAPATHGPFDFSAPRGNWPTETYRDKKTLDFNREEVELIHTEKAHSNGDTIVFFHGSNVVKAVHPTREYDPMYGGPTTGIGSADGTIEEIYDNLAGSQR